MVNSVMAVPTAKKTKRDHNNGVSYSNSKANSNHLFTQMFEQAVNEQAMNEQESSSMVCHTTTYGQNSRLQTFHYQTREYHY